MIAVDTNILVYAHRGDSPFHDRARSALESLANASREWAVPWPCAHEFLAIVTHPRIYRTATPPATALAQLHALHALPNLVFIGEADEHLQHLEPLALGARVHGASHLPSVTQALPEPPPYHSTDGFQSIEPHGSAEVSSHA